MAHNGRYVRRLHNMIRAKIQGAGFQHHPFRDGRAQVLAASWPTLSSVRCGCAAVVREAAWQR
jgi:hypothetical protein